MRGARQEGRQAALQVLYLSEIGQTGADEATRTFFAEHFPDAPAEAVAFSSEIVQGVTAERAALDVIIGAHSVNWRVERLSTIDRIVLRIAVWELRHQPGTPSAVILNEAVDLARRFGGDESSRFVNGVLDAIRKDERP